MLTWKFAAKNVRDAVWAASPLWVWWVSRPRAAAGDDGIVETDRHYLQALARDSWRLFERWVTDQDHHLPPDNVQRLPHMLVAAFRATLEETERADVLLHVVDASST